MGKVTIVKGNLFNAPEGSILVHACNCRGVWGSGIAKEFAKRFPSANIVYGEHCMSYCSQLLGTCLLIPSGNYTIGCLFTSKDYGQRVDSAAQILKSTETAVADLIKQNVGKKPIHMCKINSGLFNVPWEDTQKILEEFSEEFTVYDY